MNDGSVEPVPQITADLIAEAAAWLAVLHGPNRTQASERGFSQWMSKSAAHARAFEEATAIWEEAAGLPRPRHLRAAAAPHSATRTRVLQGAALAATLACVAIGVVAYIRIAGVATGVGEQRTLALDDGSRIVMNTRTRIVVDYDDAERTIELKDGEAVFEVARQPGRPFVVIAGHRRIQALGTSFAVRRDDDRVSVTLLEGKVTVAALDADAAEQAVSPQPGERLTFEPAAPVKADRPAVDKLLAWQRREVAFDNVALADAIAEMNRYSRRPLVAPASVPGSIRVTGLFRAGDSASFARAVAEAYDLEVVEADGRISLVEGH
jgi:transmembrane sensor